MFGVGISELSWRSILDTLKVHPLDGGRMVQVGSSFGIEALLAAMYKPELEFSISVMVSSRNREVFADDVEVALKTFRECLLPSSPTFEATLLTGPNALSTVITPFQDCWTTLGITHLVIGEGVDDSPDALDLNFAEMIIDAAKDTLVYVLTPSNDLQSLLLHRRSGWMVSGYRKRTDPVISCHTGETMFFSELYRDPRRLRSSRQIERTDAAGLPEIRKQLSLAGLRSSAELLQPMSEFVTPADVINAPEAAEIIKDTAAAGESITVDVSDDNEDRFNLHNVKVVNQSMLNLTWGMVLADKYFDRSALGGGFAKPVKIAEIEKADKKKKKQQ